jgi:hypothetical protein
MAKYGYSKNRYSVINLQLPRPFVGCMSVGPVEQILLLLPYLVCIRHLELHPIFRCELICASWLSDPSQHTHVMHTVYCVQRIRVEVLLETLENCCQVSLKEESIFVAEDPPGVHVRAVLIPRSSASPAAVPRAQGQGASKKGFQPIDNALKVN